MVATRAQDLARLMMPFVAAEQHERALHLGRARDRAVVPMAEARAKIAGIVDRYGLDASLGVLPVLLSVLFIVCALHRLCVRKVPVCIQVTPCALEESLFACLNLTPARTQMRIECSRRSRSPL